jgi:hypothetical protein
VTDVIYGPVMECPQQRFLLPGLLCKAFEISANVKSLEDFKKLAEGWKAEDDVSAINLTLPKDL